ncbi:MAG TPA: glycosyltransferase family 4 protein [Solirubrobacteraceae bacterium]|nr:glycosyltransferase family 4 protein [Solirubrobacteraceae bacterium]
MPTALLTTYLSDYRIPLFRLLAEREGVEVLAYGRGARYVPSWFTDLDGQLERAPFPARRLDSGVRGALEVGRRYDAVIAPFSGGSMLPAAFAGSRRYGRPFVLWASVWAQPRSVAHAATLPLIRHIYRDADAVVTYGEHVRSFVAHVRGRDNDVFVAPQAVEAELFTRRPEAGELATFRARNGLGSGPLVLYVGRLVSEKGIEVLADAWPRVGSPATLVLIGDGPLAGRVQALPRARHLGPLPRAELPTAYAAAALTVVPSIPTPRWREPWGLVCNEAMHQGCPVLATGAVGAVAGGLVRHGESGFVVAPGDADALASAIDALLADPQLRRRLGEGGRTAVAPYTYDAMADAFSHALRVARARVRTGHSPIEKSASRS